MDINYTFIYSKDRFSELKELEFDKAFKRSFCMREKDRLDKWVFDSILTVTVYDEIKKTDKLDDFVTVTIQNDKTKCMPNFVKVPGWIEIKSSERIKYDESLTFNKTKLRFIRSGKKQIEAKDKTLLKLAFGVAVNTVIDCSIYPDMTLFGTIPVKVGMSKNHRDSISVDVFNEFEVLVGTVRLHNWIPYGFV